MKAGSYEVFLLNAGLFRLDGGAMFGVVPRVLWEKKKKPDEFNRIPMCTNLLLLKGNDRIILIDTGIGYKEDEKFLNMYGVDFSSGHLMKELEKTNTPPEAVTDVILTHLHFDHSGGATILNEQNRLVPTFPNATYHVSEEQWKWAFHPSLKDKASYHQKHYAPLMETGQLTLVKNDLSLLPGIDLIKVNGHTPGQLLPVVRDEKQPMLFAGDLIPMSPHVSLPWIMAYDLEPLKTLQEKQEILREAEKGKWLLIFEHDPEIPAATIREGEKSFEIKEALHQL